MVLAEKAIFDRGASAGTGRMAAIGAARHGAGVVIDGHGDDPVAPALHVAAAVARSLPGAALPVDCGAFGMPW